MKLNQKKITFQKALLIIYFDAIKLIFEKGFRIHLTAEHIPHENYKFQLIVKFMVAYNLFQIWRSG